MAKLMANRTIHGMVYNAMKLFMEVNPQLFDDCSHDYAESQNNAGQKEAERKARWDQLAELAKSKQNGRVAPSLPSTATTGAKEDGGATHTEDTNGLSQDSHRRLEALRLQDDATAAPDGQRRKDHETSSSSVR